MALNKEVREFNGKMYLMEHALHADFAFVKAWKGDTMGNLYFRKTTRNFSTSMARAANITIAEVEHLVKPGEIDAECVHVPGVYVKRIYQGSNYENESKEKQPASVNNNYNPGCNALFSCGCVAHLYCSTQCNHADTSPADFTACLFLEPVF